MRDFALPRFSSRCLPVWRRNAQVWLKLSGPSLVGNFGEPLLYLLALGYGLGGFIGEVDGLPYIVFLATGIVCSSAMNTATFECLYSAYTRMKVQETWSAMLAAPLSLDDIVLGETLWAGTKSLISATAILLVAALLGLVEGWQALGVLPLAFLLGCCFGAMALVVTAISPSYDFFLYYFTLVITPMFLLSGVFFPLESVPGWVQAGVQLLPLYHVVELVRPLMTGRPLEGVVVHLLAPLLYGLAALWLALGFLRRRLLI
ncbi:nodulation protein NodJ [Candidatus Tenderia electrophaga]|jgi:lipooligosaccharide transport system permease protein|uniref:Transport permease protein n=1 Tax=Candidatus Tenderia electrophaga TaxID=1748243 RepID=A0A0S2THJ9_9GAMM|nr:nodulation protein NodJ [Candidatus Tenderia electrophaga]